MEFGVVKWITPRGKKVLGFKDNEIIRETGLIEKVCKHGVGHPIGHLTKWDDKWMGVHGCDGCCCKAEFYLGNEDRYV